MIIFDIFHAYPVEWWALACAAAAVMVGVVAAYDAHLTRVEVGEDAGVDSELFVLARGKFESTCWNVIAQALLMVVALVSVFTPPPPAGVHVALIMDPVYVEMHVFAIRTALSLISIVSMARDLRVMRVRRKILLARALRRAVIDSLAKADILALARNIETLNQTLVQTHDETAAIEHETLAKVQETHQVGVETKVIAEAIHDKLDDGRHT